MKTPARRIFVYGVGQLLSKKSPSPQKSRDAVLPGPAAHHRDDDAQDEMVQPAGPPINDARDETVPPVPPASPSARDKTTTPVPPSSSPAQETTVPPVPPQDTQDKPSRTVSPEPASIPPIKSISANDSSSSSSDSSSDSDADAHTDGKSDGEGATKKKAKKGKGKSTAEAKTATARLKAVTEARAVLETEVQEWDAKLEAHAMHLSAQLRLDEDECRKALVHLHKWDKSGEYNEKESETRANDLSAAQDIAALANRFEKDVSSNLLCWHWWH
jgi:hypothetical protein